MALRLSLTHQDNSELTYNPYQNDALAIGSHQHIEDSPEKLHRYDHRGDPLRPSDAMLVK